MIYSLLYMGVQNWLYTIHKGFFFSGLSYFA
jgi:hypothetical protein